MSEHRIPRPEPYSAINPGHYREHPSGVECIEISRHFSSNVGQAIQYQWRHLDKGDPIENLEKAVWFLNDEIKRLRGLKPTKK